MSNNLSLKWVYSPQISEHLLKFGKAINIIQSIFIQDTFDLNPEILDMSKA